MRKFFVAVMSALSFGVAGGAAAAPAFVVTGGTSFSASGNDFGWISGPLTEGGTLGLTEAGSITIEYIGKEAGFANTTFQWGSLTAGETLFSTGSGASVVGQTAASPGSPAAVGGPVSRLADAGTLLFNFLVAATGGTVQNGKDLASADDGIAFWSATGNSSVIYLLLDDSGGSPDADYDDMVVRLTVGSMPTLLATPEPSTWVMLLAGLGVIVLITRRRLRS